MIESWNFSLILDYDSTATAEGLLRAHNMVSLAMVATSVVLGLSVRFAQPSSGLIALVL
jgi:hypothetical protein